MYTPIVQHEIPPTSHRPRTTPEKLRTKTIWYSVAHYEERCQIFNRVKNLVTSIKRNMLPRTAKLFDSTAASVNCTSCPAGYFCDDPEATPQPCEVGYYSGGGSAVCSACQPGYRCPEASVSATPPGSECPEGTYCNPARTLSECPAGTYGA